MALDAQDLAKKLNETLDPSKPVPPELLAYCKGVVAALKAAIVNHPVPGSITGTCADGAPLSLGLGNLGIMVITPAPALAETAKAFAKAPMKAAETSALISYLATGTISFASGKITGNCAAGALVGGQGSGGIIVGLTGAGAAAMVAAALGSAGPNSLKFYNTLINYISSNAEAAYAANTVTGGYPTPAGGPLVGIGVGGTIS